LIYLRKKEYKLGLEEIDKAITLSPANHNLYETKYQILQKLPNTDKQEIEKVYKIYEETRQYNNYPDMSDFVKEIEKL
jgi:hypothetical protein